MRRFIGLTVVLISFVTQAQIREQKDDPQARSEFEFLRMRDPATNRLPDNIHVRERAFMRKQELKYKKNRTLAPTTDWTNRGPFNVGGRTRALAVDISDPTDSTILAGGVSGGLWRTTNGGETWNKTTTPTDLQSITCIAQDIRTGEESTWYYGTGEFSGNSASGSGAFFFGDGIFKSTDGGLNWNALAATVSDVTSFDNCFDINHEILVNPTNGDVFVANYCGIYRSQDGGNTFTQVLDNLNEDSDGGWTDVAITSTGILYAVKNFEGAGVFQSTDGGDTWSGITDVGHSFAEGERKEIAIAPSNEDMVYIIGEDASESSGHSLWKFDDALDQWTDLSANIPQLGGLTGDFDAQGGYDLLIKVKNDDPDFIVIGGTNLFASSDGFTSTENTNWIGGYTSSNNSFALYFNHHPDQHSFIFLDNDRAYSGNDGGVQLTSNITAPVVSWNPLNNGYLTSQIYAVSAGPEDQLLIGLQDNGTWFANNATLPEDSWTFPFGGDGAYSAISNDGTVRYMSSQNANIGLFNYSDAEDESSQSAFFFVPSENQGYETKLFITPFYLDPVDNDLFYLGGDNELWINDQAVSNENKNGANTGWKNVNLTGASGVVSEIGPGFNEIVYIGTSAGNVLRVSNIKGITPTLENVSGDNFPSGYISGVSVNPVNNDKVLVTFSNYNIPSVFYTSDGGETWVDVSGNLEENPDGSGSGPSVRIGRIHGNDFKFFVGTSAGLYSTDLLDGANTVWVREAEDDIGATVVEHLITRLDGLVVAATHGNGVFSAMVPLNDTDIWAQIVDQPSTGVFEESSTNVVTTVQNIGSLAINDFDISLTVNDQLIVTDNVVESLGNLDTYEHVFSQPVDFSGIGEYDIKVEVQVSGDSDESNNNVSLSIISLAVPSDITLSNETIAEMELAGTLVGTLEAVDEDDDAHTFSLVEGDGDDDNDSFRVLGTQLISGEVFNFNSKSVYTIRIQTEDDDSNTFTKSFEISISNVTAVAEWEESGITVYPNPSKGRVSIEMINDYIGDVSVKIFTLDGKEVMSQDNYSKDQKSTRSLMDISGLNQGTYLVKFTFGGKEIVSRLIKD